MGGERRGLADSVSRTLHTLIANGKLLLLVQLLLLALPLAVQICAYGVKGGAAKTKPLSERLAAAWLACRSRLPPELHVA